MLYDAIAASVFTTAPDLSDATRKAIQDVRYRVHVDMHLEESFGAFRVRRWKFFTSDFTDVTAAVQAARSPGEPSSFVTSSHETYRRSYDGRGHYTDTEEDFTTPYYLLLSAPSELGWADGVCDHLVTFRTIESFIEFAHHAHHDITPEQLLMPSRENAPSPRLTHAQLLTACRLASAFKHAWASLTHPESHLTPGEMFIQRGQGASVDEIEALTLSFETCSVGSPRYAPVVDTNGEVVYATESRRYGWRVAPDGAMIATINRPEGVALTITVPSDRDATITVERGDVPIYARHISAAFTVLSVVTSPRTAFWLLRDQPCIPDENDRA